MKAVFDARQSIHNPKHFVANGAIQANPETPDRADRLREGAESVGCEFLRVQDHGLGPIAAVHSVEYIRFLRTIVERWRRVSGASEEVIPSTHPDRRLAGYPKSPAGLAGYHQVDTSCPISDGTFESAYWSAQTALTAGDLIVGGEHSAYALCRPPGHHAFSDLAGGFCFFNNTAIVANHLADLGMRPAILDVDVHHGNGTQGIFYRRRDVLTVSLHADPAGYYPFYWGYEAERGDADGIGYNRNYPLPRGIGDAEYLAALEPALEYIADFAPDVLVLALGLDAFEGDPLRGMRVTTAGFEAIGARIAELGFPTLIVQEGGYLCDALADNLAAVLKAF